VSNGVLVRLDPFEQSCLFEFGDDPGAGLESIQAAETGWGLVSDSCLGREDVDRREVVTLADFEVERVVGRSHLDRPRTEGRVDSVVCHDGHLPVNDGEADRLPDQPTVALVLGMHGDGCVAQHGLGPGRRDDDVPDSGSKRIA
jgi:hypothetical protein